MIQHHSGYKGVYGLTVISSSRWRTGLRFKSESSIVVFNQNRQPLSEIPRISPVYGTSAPGLRTGIGQHSAAHVLLLLLCVEGGEKEHGKWLKVNVMAWKHTCKGEQFLKWPVALHILFLPCDLYPCIGLLSGQIHHPILPWLFNRYGIKDCQVLCYTFIQLEMREAFAGKFESS